MRISSMISSLFLVGAFLLVAPSRAARPPSSKKSVDTASPSSFGLGLPQSRLISTPPVLSIRGGDVQEPTTLADVESIILKASAEGKLVVIDFSATWCGPCKMIAPIFHELSEKDALKDSVVFLKVDVDENPDTAAKYSVSAMPTFVFIKGGDVVDRLMGANPARLMEMVQELA
uniref:Thioredoxin domain-containing protein n=1 Tax=Pseudictyota dubia TaxID=2749911 RepID=A0A7R9WDZ5_9STRA